MTGVIAGFGPVTWLDSTRRTTKTLVGHFVDSTAESVEPPVSDLGRKMLTRWWVRGSSGIIALLAFALLIGVDQKTGIRNNLI